MPGTGKSVLTTDWPFVGTKCVKLAISMIKVVISVEISPRPSFVEEHMLIEEGNRARKSLGSNDDIWLHNLDSTPGLSNGSAILRHRICRGP